MTALLQILLPLKGKLLGFIPGFAQLKAFFWGAILIGLLTAGGIAGAAISRRGEPARIAAAAQPLCDAAAHKKELQVLKDAVAQGELARVHQSDQLELQTKIIQAFEKEQLNAEDKSPDLDRVVVPGDSPWLQRTLQPKRR